VAKKGDTVEVQYVLHLYATDSQAQSSWTLMPFSFTWAWVGSSPVGTKGWWE
jgi:hypothetical protein